MKRNDSLDIVGTTVISTRIRLARNVEGFAFPHKITKTQGKEIADRVDGALFKMDDFHRYDLDDIGETETTLLEEQYLISPALKRHKAVSSAFVSSDREVSVMVNEEDHLREQYILKGFDLYKAYERISGIDDGLNEALPFAFDRKLGYLTACPSNLGTGMRASVLMFLPALSKEQKLKGLLPALKKNGLTVRGGFGEGTKADGYTYQISNEQTLGYSEADILSHVNEVCLNLADLESRARERMLDEDEIGYRDLCLRAYGAITNCARLTEDELLAAIVKIRLGCALGFFKAESSEAFHDFVANMRPASFRTGNCKGATKEEENVVRAKIVGKVLPRLVKRTD